MTERIAKEQALRLLHEALLDEIADLELSAEYLPVLQIRIAHDIARIIWENGPLGWADHLLDGKSIFMGEFLAGQLKFYDTEPPPEERLQDTLIHCRMSGWAPVLMRNGHLTVAPDECPGIQTVAQATIQRMREVQTLTIPREAGLSGMFTCDYDPTDDSPHEFLVSAYVENAQGEAVAKLQILVPIDDEPEYTGHVQIPHRHPISRSAEDVLLRHEHAAAIVCSLIADEMEATL